MWYTVGAALNIALFPIVSVYLKTRAPGAKTYLQVSLFAWYDRALPTVRSGMDLLSLASGNVPDSHSKSGVPRGGKPAINEREQVPKYESHAQEHKSQIW